MFFWYSDSQNLHPPSTSSRASQRFEPSKAPHSSAARLFLSTLPYLSSSSPIPSSPTLLSCSALPNLSYSPPSPYSPNSPAADARRRRLLSGSCLIASCCLRPVRSTRTSLPFFSLPPRVPTYSRRAAVPYSRHRRPNPTPHGPPTPGSEHPRLSRAAATAVPVFPRRDIRDPVVSTSAASLRLFNHTNHFTRHWCHDVPFTY